MLIKNICLNLSDHLQKAVTYDEEVERCNADLSQLRKGLLNCVKECTTCNKAGIPSDCTLECSNCLEQFHITCINHSVDYDTAREIKRNPCVWWICFSCLHTNKAVNENVVDDTAAKHSNADDLDKLIDNKIQSLLGNFKNELLEGIELRLGPSQKQVSPPHSTSSSSSSLSTGTKRKADDDHTTVAKIPRNCSSAPPFVSHPLDSDTDSPESIVEVARKRSPSKVTEPSVRTEKFILHYRPVSDTMILKDEEWVDLRKSISSKLSTIKVLFSHFNKKTGKVVVGFPSKRSKDMAAELLRDAISLRCYELYVPEKMLPKLTVHNVPLDFDLVNSDSSGQVQRDLVKGQIWETIMGKNDGVKSLVESGSSLEIVYFRKHTFSATVAIKVSPELRLFILEKLNSKLFLFSNCCRVSDRCHYQQCYHCLKYGHIAKNCPKANDSPICMYCANSHDSRSCAMKKSTADYRCYNCLSSDPPLSNFNHCACSSSCP